MPRNPINIIFIEKIADLLINEEHKKAPEIFNEIIKWSAKKYAALSVSKSTIPNDVKFTQSTYQNYPSFRTVREYIRKIKNENLIPNIEERRVFNWPESMNQFSSTIPWSESRNVLDCSMWYMKKFSQAPSIGIVKWYVRISHASGSFKDIEQKCLKSEIFWCSEILNGYSPNSSAYNTLYEQLQLQFRTWELRGAELETSGFNQLVRKFNAKPWINQINPSYRDFFFEMMPHFKWFYDQNREYHPQPFNSDKNIAYNHSDIISRLNSIENNIKQISTQKINSVEQNQSQMNSWKLHI